MACFFLRLIFLNDNPWVVLIKVDVGVVGVDVGFWINKISS